MSLKEKRGTSLRGKLHLLLDEGILLLRESRELVGLMRERRGVDLYGPRGTEVRFPTNGGRS